MNKSIWTELNTNEVNNWIDDYYNKYVRGKTEHEFFMATVEDPFFSKYVWLKGALWKLLHNKDCDTIRPLRKEWCDFYMDNKDNYKRKVVKYFYFFTATGKDRIDVNDENICKMYELNKKLFNNDNYKRFHKVCWNIETGKHEDRPNLHTHALIVFDSTNKNFKRDYSNSFKKVFKKEGVDIDIKMFGFLGNQGIYQDKLEYLQNVKKSILHKNYKDLEILEYLEN